MTKEEATIGTVVRLKSGGLPMTVEYIVSNLMVKCVWFDYDNQLCREEFKIELLEKSEPRNF